MIVPRVPLHVGRLRHVAVHALIAGGVGLVKAVGLGHDDGRFRVAAGRVATHAQLIARQQCFHAVHVMTILTTHTRAVHPGMLRNELNS